MQTAELNAWYCHVRITLMDCTRGNDLPSTTSDEP